MTTTSFCSLSRRTRGQIAVFLGRRAPTRKIIELINTRKVEVTDFSLGPDRRKAFDELVDVAKTESD
jgi:hypothetical protein